MNCTQQPNSTSTQSCAGRLNEEPTLCSRARLPREWQELKGNIRVFARVRPSDDGCALNIDDDNGAISVPYNGVYSNFKFDRAFSPLSTQEVRADAAIFRALVLPNHPPTCCAGRLRRGLAICAERARRVQRVPLRLRPDGVRQDAHDVRHRSGPGHHSALDRPDPRDGRVGGCLPRPSFLSFALIAVALRLNRQDAACRRSA